MNDERRVPPSLALLIATIALCGIAILIAAGLSWNDEDRLLLASLAALTIVAEHFDFKPFQNSSVSLSISFIFAAAILSGLPGVAVVASTSVIAHLLLRRPAIYKAAFNEGCLLLTGAAFVGMLEAFSATPKGHDAIAVLGPVLLGTFAAFVINSGLVGLALAMSTGRRPFAVWNSAFRWFLPHYVALGVLAVAMSESYERWELAGFALLIVPLAMAWLAIKQYVVHLPHCGRAATSGSAA